MINFDDKKYNKIIYSEHFWRINKISTTNLENFYLKFKEISFFDNHQWNKKNQTVYCKNLQKNKLLNSNQDAKDLTANSRGYKKKFEELGLCYIDNKDNLNITTAGKNFLNCSYNALTFFKTNQLIKFHYFFEENPFLPYLFLLKILEKIEENYITDEEFKLFVFRSTRNDDLETVLNLIRQWRNFDILKKNILLNLYKNSKKTKRGSTIFKSINSYSSYSFNFFGESEYTIIDETEKNKIIAIQSEKKNDLSKIFKLEKSILQKKDNYFNYLSSGERLFNLNFDLDSDVKIENIKEKNDDTTQREINTNPYLFLTIDFLNLSPKINSSLRDLNISYLGDLIQYNEKQLLRLQGFGKTSLDALKEKLSKYSLKFLNEILIDWPPNDLEKKSREIQLLQEKERKKFKEKDLLYEEQKNNIFLNDLKQKNFLEDQINLILNRFKFNQIEAVKLYYGLDFEKRRTLEVTGHIYGVTRERIRQIIFKFNRTFKRDFIPPTLEKINLYISKNTPLELSLLNEQLYNLGYVKEKFNSLSLEGINEFFGIKNVFRLAVYSGKIYYDNIVTSKVKSIIKFLDDKINSYGVLDINFISKNLGIPEKKILNFIKTNKDFGIIDDKWIYLVSKIRNRLYNHLIKIFNVANRISLSQIISSINRNKKIVSKINSNVLINYIKIFFNCDYIDGEIIVDKNNIPEYLHNTSIKAISDRETIIINCFKKNKLFTFETLQKEMILNKFGLTAFQSIGNSPIITRVAPATYSLIGTTFFAGEIDEFVEKNKKKINTTIEYDYLNNDEILIKYPMNSLFINGRNFRIPTTLRKIITNENYSIANSSKQLIIKKGYISGLVNNLYKHFFKENYYINFKFNFNTKVVVIENEKSNFLFK